MKILLATDGSQHSEAAIDEIASRLFPAGSAVRVISVLELPTFPIAVPWSGVELDEGMWTGMENNDTLQKTAREAALAVVEKAAARLRAGKESRQLSVTTEVLFGSPKRVILEEAEAFGADLIVVGSHGHGALERFLIGSVSQAVALHAKCSVEIVRKPKRTANKGK